jgi:hypothetical protein
MMKTRIWLLLTLLLAMSLAACQPAAPTTTPGGGAETEAPAPAATAIPEEAQPYPYPPAQSEGQASETQTSVTQTEAPAASGGPAYPAPGEPQTVEWSEAEQVILNGEVSQIDQKSTLEVTLTLKDSRVLITTEPSFDEVVRVKERCAEVCAGLIINSMR